MSYRELYQPLTINVYRSYFLIKQAHFIPPADYDRIKIVSSFDELVTSVFGPKVNAMCWPRMIAGDFDELARYFSDVEDVMSLDAEILSSICPRLSDMGKLAVNLLLGDQRMLQAHGMSPSLECVPRYLRDDILEAVPTDVYSFHADRAPVRADTYLCSYNEAATEGLRNDMAQKHIDIAATRARLYAQFEREGADDFETYLKENCYDLHYAPLVGAVPFSFGLGHLWRIAIEYPGCPVPPCLHRAPETVAGRPPRLLLIS